MQMPFSKFTTVLFQSAGAAYNRVSGSPIFWSASGMFAGTVLSELILMGAGK